MYNLQLCMIHWYAKEIGCNYGQAIGSYNQVGLSDWPGASGRFGIKEERKGNLFPQVQATYGNQRLMMSWTCDPKKGVMWLKQY